MIIETGMGACCTRRVLDWLLGGPNIQGSHYEPQAILFAGFAGALASGLEVGDLVLADAIADTDGNRWATTWPGALPQARRLPLHIGTLLSTPRVIGVPAEKCRLGAKQHALAVDMESATLAAIAGQRGIPFGSLRVISDTVDTALSPQIVRLLEGGRIAWSRVALLLLRRPAIYKELARLARDTRKAAARLAQGLHDLLQCVA